MTGTQQHVLILGGTTEGRGLAEALAGEPAARWRVTSSLAGLVAAPRLPPGEVRTGGFGGTGGLVRWLREHAVDVVVDATHPFAETMSAHAAAAAAATGVPLLGLRRPGWTAGPGDRWHMVDSAEQAAALLPALGGRVFLTTGRTGLAAFAGDAGRWFLVRSVDAPGPPHPPRMEVVLDRGPFTHDGERALMTRHRVDVLVTKDSGGAATAPKLAVARELGLPVVIVRRPPAPPGVPAVPDVAGALEWLRAGR
ncbi:cobalt-precorrin-6A reductase [Streptomyces sp. MI02-7b]|uniref:cobalt-precorrin-6A reductase n=1 Tax=Streptomyces sp. MI02-7b TaxID=462941 RepID=UPI0029BC2B2E|nr:cobalt-precorrin-6A reductase [Streptomyces sp. MI02-7b]MDX3073397.1 cobalt-precorrin-6A reductase [Streptomyces sp. MI02-7b]